MSLPGFERVMRPLLASLADGGAIHRRVLVAALADEFGLTEAERAAVLPRGKQAVFDNQVAWAASHLFQAGLLARPHRGELQITDEGRAALVANPESVTVAVLRGYESYRAFRARSVKKTSARPSDASGEGEGRAEAEEDHGVEAVAAAEGASPLALLDQAVAESEADVRGELLVRALALSPRDFERLVVVLLERMGYGASGTVEHSGQPGDAGIDAVVSQDPLGLDRIFVQAKRYAPDQSVQRPAVQAFVGALMGAQGDRGVFITTSRFSEGARREAERVNARVELIDGARLADLMLANGVGVQAEVTVTLHRIDEDFFDVL